jgi:hypothetical protein
VCARLGLGRRPIITQAPTRGPQAHPCGDGRAGRNVGLSRAARPEGRAAGPDGVGAGRCVAA